MGPRALSALVVIPDHAKILSTAGWTKQMVRDSIIKASAEAAPATIGRGRGLRDEDFMLIVAGGPGVWMGLHQSAGGFGNRFITREIQLPRNWGQLVAKYKNLVPVYVRY
jgi:hypothetical protein